MIGVVFDVLTDFDISLSVNMAIIIHQHCFDAGTIHIADRMKDSYHFSSPIDSLLAIQISALPLFLVIVPALRSYDKVIVVSES